MYINYDYYRIFYYVAKYQNVTQAAHALLNNQPNVTRAIKNLESGLGCALFTRSNRGMKLTPEGRRLFEHVRVAVEQLQAGEEELAALSALHGGLVSISASEVALRCFLLPVLREYQQRYPQIKLRVSNSSTPQALEALRSRAADIALVTTPTGSLPGLDCTKVKQVREVAVCGTAFRKLAEGPVSLDALAKLPIVSLGTHTQSYAFYSQLFLRHGLEFTPYIEVSTADQILPMVKSNLGIGFVPRAFLEEEAPGSLSVISLKEPVPPRWVVLAKRSGDALSMAVAALEKMVLEKRNAAQNQLQTPPV